MATSSTTPTTSIHDLPEPILSKIFTAISDTRTRNNTSRVNHKWYELERTTRTSLSLRGNVRDLLFLPNSFHSITHLDLSHLSPWGHPLLATLTSDNHLLAHRIAAAFPSITHLTIYARHPSVTLSLLCPHWPNLTHVKLVRWHQRPPNDGPHGSELSPLFESCRSISVLDLSSFYCWTEDIPAALTTAASNPGLKLTHLNLFNSSFAEGFKSNEIEQITLSCPNLREFLVPCTFDPRYIGYIGDTALLTISTNCKFLKLLHLADISGEVIDAPIGVDAQDEAGFTIPGLIEFFHGLVHIEELNLDICKTVRESWVALEVLANKCPNLKTLKLGQFNSICRAIESQLDGIALCKRLISLSIKDVVDLTDFGLIAIARGCSRLERFEIHGCGQVTVRGLRTLASLLWRTLVDVKISKCSNFDASTSLQAVEPICDRIKRLHIDCVWSKAILEGEGEFVEPPPVEDLFPFDLNEVDDGSKQQEEVEAERSTKRQKFWSQLDDQEQQKKPWHNQCATASTSATEVHRNGDGEFWSLGCNGDTDNYNNNNNANIRRRRWTKLEFLSLWIGVGELITPLTSPALGLEDCPNLTEIHIKAEGDCREKPRPTFSRPTFGLSSLAQYPSLSKLKVDLGDTIGYALTAPSGHVDLSLWERFYLDGIGGLVSLEEVDYWPPHDRDVNQRGVSLPGAASLGQCYSLRKLFIHGTTHEHFLNFLLKIDNLRDVQLREDYYPAPEDDMSTEMRVDSCRRFEESINQRPIPD